MEIKVKPIPDTFRSIDGHRLYVLERGIKSYLILDLDSSHPYKVYERVLQDSPRGYIEVLKDNQAYQAFRVRNEADRHYKRVEAGWCPVILK